MKNGLRTREQRMEYVCRYFREGEKNRDEWALGMEFEHFVFDRKTKQRVFYEPTVRRLLEKIASLSGFQAIYADQHILGVHHAAFEISIEPGAQFEISLERSHALRNLKEGYEAALQLLEPVFEEEGLMLLAIGVDPENTINQIPIIPKERYRYMNDYLKERGIYAQSMMRQSCALQVAIDYESERDCGRKMAALTALSPILYTLFDHAPLHDGKEIEHYNLRQEIWRHMDSDRCEWIPEIFLETPYESYAKWLLDIPLLFVPEIDGQLRAVGTATLDQVLQEAQTPAQAMRYLEHALSIVFPDIRLKHYLEVRMMDAVPPELAFGAAALLKGLFYDEDNLTWLQEQFADFQEDWVRRGQDAGHDHGLQGFYHGDYIGHWGLRLLERARLCLDAQEQQDLQPLEDLWSQLDAPRDRFLRRWKQEGRAEALQSVCVLPPEKEEA